MPPTGIGLALRTAFFDALERGEGDGRLAFVEVAPENYMHRGGTLPRRLARVAERFPVLTHGLMMNLGSTDPLDRDYLTELAAFLRRYAPPWHSDHLSYSGVDGVLLHELLPLPWDPGTAQRVAERVLRAQDALDCTVAIENISAYLRWGEPYYAETDFILDVLRRCDGTLLLDVNNVLVNAENHGFDPYAWLAEIPLERVVQIHVAGHERCGDGSVLDTHGADVSDEVAALLGWVIERAGPRPVLLERDANVPPFAVLLEELEHLDAVYRAALERRSTAS